MIDFLTRFLKILIIPIFGLICGLIGLILVSLVEILSKTQAPVEAYGWVTGAMTMVGFLFSTTFILNEETNGRW